MEIVWYGHACFRLRGKDITIITDPYGEGYGYSPPRIRADIVTISHENRDHNYAEAIQGDPKVIRGPGEYEIGGVFITGIVTYHDAEEGGKRGKNTVYLFDWEDLAICHLGDLGHIPTQTDMERLGDIDILLIPVGGVYTIDAAQASEVISLLEPKIVIPMHYRAKALTGSELAPISRFLKEMGLREAAPQPSLRVVSGTLPAETQVIVLQHKG